MLNFTANCRGLLEQLLGAAPLPPVFVNLGFGQPMRTMSSVISDHPREADPFPLRGLCWRGLDPSQDRPTGTVSSSRRPARTAHWASRAAACLPGPPPRYPASVRSAAGAAPIVPLDRLCRHPVDRRLLLPPEEGWHLNARTQSQSLPRRPHRSASSCPWRGAPCRRAASRTTRRGAMLDSLGGTAPQSVRTISTTLPAHDCAWQAERPKRLIPAPPWHLVQPCRAEPPPVVRQELAGRAHRPAGFYAR